MTNSAKDKGDRGEREVEALLRSLLGIPEIRRALGAGRKDDMGDITNVPNTTIQVAWRERLLEAITEKVPACEEQQVRAGTAFGATFLRTSRRPWLVVQTPEQWAELWLAAHPELEA